jgi:hypothetical protein
MKLTMAPRNMMSARSLRGPSPCLWRSTPTITSDAMKKPMAKRKEQVCPEDARRPSESSSRGRGASANAAR